MKINRTENTKRNIVWGGVNVAISLLLPFVARTCLLKVLGEEYLGLSSVFTSILQVLSLTELGLSSAIVYCLYRPIAEDDKETICAYLGLYRKAYRIIGFSIALVGIILIPCLPYIVEESEVDINLYGLFVIYLANTVLGYFLFAYKNTLLIAHHRSDIVSNVGTAVNFFKYGLQIVLLVLFKNYYIYIIVLPISTIINNILVAIVVDKKYPEYICKDGLEKEKKQLLYTKIKGIFFTKICGVLRDAADTIIISIFLSLRDVAIFSNYFYIMSSLHALMTVITTSMRAGIGNSLVTENSEKNYQDLCEFTYYYALITSICTACLLCLYQPFMNIWVGESLQSSFSTMVLFVIYFYLLSATDIRNVYIEAAGLWYEFRIRAVMETICNLSLNIILVNCLGVAGILIATIVTFLIINILYGSNIFIKKIFVKYSFVYYILRFFAYAFLALIVSLLSFFVTLLIPHHNIFWFLLKAVAVFIVSGVVFVLLTLKADEQKKGVERVKSLLVKKRL